MAKKLIKLSAEQVKELKTLCEAAKKSGRASESDRTGFEKVRTRFRVRQYEISKPPVRVFKFDEPIESKMGTFPRETMTCL